MELCLVYKVCVSVCLFYIVIHPTSPPWITLPELASNNLPIYIYIFFLMNISILIYIRKKNKVGRMSHTCNAMTQKAKVALMS